MAEKVQLLDDEMRGLLYIAGVVFPLVALAYIFIPDTEPTEVEKKETIVVNRCSKCIEDCNDDEAMLFMKVNTPEAFRGTCIMHCSTINQKGTKEECTKAMDFTLSKEK